ncbi:MAG: hypothetical protein ACRC8A_16935 [Microcoleaceae cyanobacterium]
MEGGEEELLKEFKPAPIAGGAYFYLEALNLRPSNYSEEQANKGATLCPQSQERGISEPHQLHQLADPASGDRLARDDSSGGI